MNESFTSPDAVKGSSMTSGRGSGATRGGRAGRVAGANGPFVPPG